MKSELADEVARLRARVAALEFEVRVTRESLDALRESDHRFRTILDVTPDAVFLKDYDGRFVLVNPATTRLFGRPAKDLIGRGDDAVLPADTAARSALVDARVLAGELVEDELVLERDGAPVVVHVTRLPLRDRHGTVVGICGVARDVTRLRLDEAALREARDRAEAASRAKTEFLANMSHELRTPLHGVVGMVELLLQGTLRPDQRRYAETVHRSSGALLAIVSDLMDFSRIDAGRLLIDPVPFDLTQTVEEVADMLAARAGEAGVDLIVHIGAEVPRHLVGDAGRIRQVLANLVGNALKFTHAGHVLVDVSSPTRTDDAAALHVIVEDTGIGIPRERVATIFDKFTQVDASSTRRYGGLGLGLAISRRLVEMMGGRIGVDSAPGHGSRFWFDVTLPRYTAPADPPPTPELSGVRALVVSAHALKRAVLRETLAGFGLRADAAPSSDAALDTLRAADRDGDPAGLLVLDGRTPGAESLAETLAADSRFAGLPRVLLAWVGRTAAPAARDGLYAAQVIQPVHEAQLRDALVGALRHRPRAAEVPTEGPVPLARSAAPPASDARATARGRVLVVEDNDVNQEVAVAILTRLQCAVDLASNGVEALRRLERETYDLVLMDWQMPEMDGLEATAHIRASESGTGRHVPIVAMTGHVVDRDRERCLEVGMDDFLPKPASLDDYRRVVERWMGRLESF